MSLESIISRCLNGIYVKTFTSRISYTSRYYYIRVPRNIGEELHGKDVIIVIIPLNKYEEIKPKAE